MPNVKELIQYVKQHGTVPLKKLAMSYGVQVIASAERDELIQSDKDMNYTLTKDGQFSELANEEDTIFELTSTVKDEWARINIDQVEFTATIELSRDVGRHNIELEINVHEINLSPSELKKLASILVYYADHIWIEKGTFT